MSLYHFLLQYQQKKKSRLCIGLDPRIEYLPLSMQNNVEDFLKKIVDATHPFACAYKFNLAYYEQFGADGFRILEALLSHLRSIDNIPVIADAKRSDVPHTAEVYAAAYFRHFNFDAITVNPLLGKDSILPFLRYQDKIVFILAFTSNAGATDFLLQEILKDHGHLYNIILARCAEWGDSAHLGFVVAGTDPLRFQEIRRAYPEHLLLVPGIGAQGGEIEILQSINLSHPTLYTVSRAILYASRDRDFERAAATAAQLFQQKSWEQ